MNSKQFSLITLTACSVALLAAGCCYPQSKPQARIPRIIAQPNNVEIGTNVSTQLELQVSAADRGKVKFYWYREVPVSSCANCPGLKNPEATCDGVAFEWQTWRTGWNSNILKIENTSTNDEGFYGCVIIPWSEDSPASDLSTRTRLTYLKVFAAPSPKLRPNNFFMSQQIASRNLSNFPPGTTTPLCNMDCYVYWNFKTSNTGKVFASTNTGPCIITAARIVNGATIQLKNTEFTVMAVEVAGNPPWPYDPPRTNCTTPVGNSPPELFQRQFDAKKTSYWFYFGAIAAPTPVPIKYILTVNFP